MNNSFVKMEEYVIDLIKNIEKCDKVSYDLEKDRLVIDMGYARKNLDKFTVDFTTISECIQSHLDVFPTESKTIVRYILYPSHDRNLSIRIDMTSTDTIFIDIILYI